MALSALWKHVVCPIFLAPLERARELRSARPIPVARSPEAKLAWRLCLALAALVASIVLWLGGAPVRAFFLLVPSAFMSDWFVRRGLNKQATCMGVSGWVGMALVIAAILWRIPVVRALLVVTAPVSVGTLYAAVLCNTWVHWMPPYRRQSWIWDFVY